MHNPTETEAERPVGPQPYNETKEMPVLDNARHERIAQALANGQSQTQAYIEAGYSEKSADANSVRLMREYGESIRERRDEILASRCAKVAENHSLEGHLATLAELRDEARALGKYDAAISAEHKRGQALGYYISRSESGAPGTFTARTREEADKQLDTSGRHQRDPLPDRGVGGGHPALPPSVKATSSRAAWCDSDLIGAGPSNPSWVHAIQVGCPALQ